MKRFITVLLLLLFATRGSALADAEAARFFTERGRKAIEDKDLDEAERNFTKALGEEDGFLPALYGMALLFEARGEKARAIGYLQACLDQAEREDLDDEGRTAVAGAEERMNVLDRPRLEYRQLVKAYVAKLLDLAKTSEKGSPDLARRCLLRILRVDPGNEEATRLQKTLGGAPTSAPAASDEVLLFDGSSLSGWSGEPPVWNLKDGLLVAVAGDGAYYCRHDTVLSGDYSVSWEMRLKEETGGTACVGLTFGFQGSYENYSLWVFNARFQLRHTHGGPKDEEKLQTVEFYKLKGGIDRSIWNRYEVQVKGGELTCLANGIELFHYDAPENVFGGSVAVVVQDCTAEFRRIARVGGGN